MTTTLWAGLTMGAIYALVALGYNLTLILSGVINFANAQYLVIGAFIAVWGLGAGLPLPAVVLLAAVVAGLAALLTERIAIRPLRGVGDHTELVTTLGVSTIIMGFALLWFGPDPIGVSVMPADSLDLFGGRVRLNEIVLLLMAVVITVAAHHLVHRTRLGLAGLARSEDPEAASLRGIDVRALSIVGFVAAGLAGGLIGPLVAQKTYAVATLGLLMALKGFIALAVGGVGSITGSLVGGVVVGLIEALAARYLGNDFGAVSVIVLLFAVLLLRPDGILGRRSVRVV